MFRKTGTIIAKVVHPHNAEARNAAIQQMLSWVKEDQVISAHDPRPGH
jgi:hypothetical protein